MQLMLLAARHVVGRYSNCDVCGRSYNSAKRKTRRSRWLLSDAGKIIKTIDICVSCLREAIGTTRT